MKKISDEIAVTNIFFIVSFIFIYFIFSYYFSYQIRHEQKNAIRNLQHFVENEVKSFNEENTGNNREIKKLAEDIYRDQKGNDDYSINFFYEGKITAQNKNMVKKFDGNEGKIVREGNFYILNFEKYIKISDEKIKIQIVNDFSSGMEEIKRIKKLFLGFLILIFFISVLINRRFYVKLKRQIESVMKSTNSIDISNFETEINEKKMYYEFKNLINAYKIMVEKIKKQTESEIEFVNNASHELKTPIFILKGYIELLEKKGTEDKLIFGESVAALKNEVKDISLLIEKLLFLARKSYNEISYEDIEINEICYLIKEEMDIVYPENKINIIGSVLNVKTDRKLLKQMIRNIIENALKYGNNSEVEIIISENSEREEKKIIISDSGKGIEAEEIKNIFRKFYRVDKSRRRDRVGHGLGLSIVEAIAELLNIEVEVKSIKDKGTSFILIFKEVKK